MQNCILWWEVIPLLSRCLLISSLSFFSLVWLSLSSSHLSSVFSLSPLCLLSSLSLYLCLFSLSTMTLFVSRLISPSCHPPLSCAFIKSLSVSLLYLAVSLSLSASVSLTLSFCLSHPSLRLLVSSTLSRLFCFCLLAVSLSLCLSLSSLFVCVSVCIVCLCLSECVRVFVCLSVCVCVCVCVCVLIKLKGCWRPLHLQLLFSVNHSSPAVNQRWTSLTIIKSWTSHRWWFIVWCPIVNGSLKAIFANFTSKPQWKHAVILCAGPLVYV